MTIKEAGLVVTQVGQLKEVSRVLGLVVSQAGAGAEAARGSVTSEEAALPASVSVTLPLQGSGGRCPGPEPNLFFGCGRVKMIEYQFGVTYFTGSAAQAWPGGGGEVSAFDDQLCRVTDSQTFFLELL